MKRIGVIFTVAAAGFLSAQANAHGVPSATQMSMMVRAAEQVLANRINWQVGDFHDFGISLASMGELGQGHKEVTKEDTAQNAIWLVQTLDVMGQAQKVEALISRVDGHEIKRIVNGKEEQVGKDDTQIDIIEQSESTVTVPAGTFDCMYIKAKITQKGQEPQEVELYINPTDVNLDGTLKMIMQSQYGAVTLELKKFGPKR